MGRRRPPLLLQLLRRRSRRFHFRRPGGRRRPRRPHSPWASLPEVLEGHLSVHLSVRRHRPSRMGRLALRRPRAKFRLRRGGL
ncbi:unnamed protein product [Linum tenue]|uniref:Uncharacterized protein n=1 Tax=Linum tenue TaxID=586396 RepID=A0AAV0R5V1_9ROSI|nr:unnamed protein product [Linum tenue]